MVLLILVIPYTELLSSNLPDYILYILLLVLYRLNIFYVSIFYIIIGPCPIIFSYDSKPLIKPKSHN